MKYDGKLAIYTAFYNYMAYSPYVRSLATTLGVLSHFNIRHEYIMSAANFHVEQAVNTFLTDLLDSDFTDVLFIDSDESWDAKDIVRLLFHTEDIVGASYRMKNRWHEHVGRILFDGNAPAGKMLKDGTPLLKADRVAAGFIRIKVSALKRWAEAYPELRVEDGGRSVVQFFSRAVFDGELHDQDMSFCRRWLEIGGELWIDPNINVSHWGFEEHPGDLNGHIKSLYKSPDADVKAAFDTIREMASEIEARRAA